MLKRYYLLPKSVQNALFDEKTSDTIHKTCLIRDAETHTSMVAKLTGRVLLGYLRPELFALEIQKETGIDMQKAQLVAHDLDMEIFSAVRLELKKLYPPTIQTPTVQTWMAQKTELRSTNYEVRKTDAPTPAAKPRYVMPIPEKFLNPETRNIKLETQDQKPTNQSGEVGFPTTGTPSNSIASLQRQMATNMIGSQRAEARPPSAGGGQVSQIAKETSGNQGAEARPLEEKSNMARPDLQQPANQELRIMNEETLAKEKGSAQPVIRNSYFVIRFSAD